MSEENKADPGRRMRILFVDDEPQVLDGIRDLLRTERKRWDMVFANGGQAALDQLRAAPFDVVVSDMQMPGVDGASVLEAARQESPATARIILSGQADQARVMRALPNSHQFLSKPCDARVLRSTIDRACRLHALLRDEELRKIVGKTGRLPSLPNVYWELSQAIAQAKVSPRQIAGIIEKDPAMSAKLLQLVNSSYFGLGKRISSIEPAVVYLGVETVRNAVVTAHVFKSGEKAPKVDGVSIEQLQEQSLMVARVSKRLCLGTPLADDAYAAGLLYDVGQLVLLLNRGEAFGQAVAQARSSGRPQHEVEQELLGVSHSHVGAYLLGLWGLPYSIVEAAAHHHTPSVIQGTTFEVLSAVHVASAIVETHKNGNFYPEQARLDLGYIASIGKSGEIRHWEDLAMQELRGASAQK